MSTHSCDAPRMRSGLASLCVVLSVGCGSTADPNEDDASGTTQADEETSSTSGGEQASSTSGDGDESSTGGDESSTGDDPPTPMWGEPEALPTPDGACPTFQSGTLDFAPAETVGRQARVWVDPEAGGGGPLVFYWHGTGSNPLEAEYGLGQAGIDDILMRGGMVVAPVADPEAGQFPWYLVIGQEEDDLHLMDEIVGCAAQGPGIDASRIHSIGMSAGGLQTTQASIRRASYIASTVVYSGGLLDAATPSDAPDRPLSSMIYHGGPDDIVVISFQQTSERYKTYVDDRDGYSILCDHGGAHTIPDARIYSWQFMLDHPFGITPFPYDGALPEWVPDYCSE